MGIDPKTAKTMGAVAPAMMPLVRHAIQSHFEKKRFEREREIEMELIEARSEASSKSTPVVAQRSPQPAPEPPGDDGIKSVAKVAERYVETYETVHDTEDCGVCKQVLEHLRDMPLEQQVQGLKELAELEEAAVTGVDPEEMATMFDDFEILNAEALAGAVV